MSTYLGRGQESKIVDGDFLTRAMKRNLWIITNVLFLSRSTAMKHKTFLYLAFSKVSDLW